MHDTTDPDNASDAEFWATLPADVVPGAAADPSELRKELRQAMERACIRAIEKAGVPNAIAVEYVGALADSALSGEPEPSGHAARQLSDLHPASVEAIGLLMPPERRERLRAWVRSTRLTLGATGGGS